ncbi:hypothetical protein HQO42_05305 [Rhodococcus fascians]|nr:hypothetical protein [Rhodococcus fascians]MBY4236578.1 hypothetical protein [Rhodococcus fascians]MBY4252056.1 hypothetical protein [Rhodococcus fascians]MBY4267922.1 hypothetical protein [Rhodococcus fascians]
MSERCTPSTKQYELISPRDCYAELDSSEKRDLRAHLSRVVMTNLAIISDLTEVLAADREENKSRRKPITLPEHWLESPS